MTRRAFHQRLGVTALALVLPSVAHAGGAEKKKGGGASYIQFPPLEASVSHGMARRGVLSVEGGIDVPDTALHQRADQFKPVLLDAYLRWLVIYAASLPQGAAPNPDQIEGELQRCTDRVLGRAGARFLIGTVMVT